MELPALFRNKIFLLVLGLALVAGMIWWARTGFSLQFGRSKASCEAQICPNGVWNPSTCQCEFGGGTTITWSPVPGSSTGDKTTPHSYCDYATNSCQTKATEDWNAPQCGSGGSCAPGNCRLWTGSSTTWTPGAGPSGVPACEPLSQIPGTTISGYVGGVLNPAPTGFPQCFVINLESSADPNWGTTTEHTIPQILKDNPGAKLFYRAFAVNNCPWPVHMVFQDDGSKKASFDTGVGKRSPLPDSENAKAFKVSAPNGYTLPSCWNTGSMSKDCAREIRIDYDLNTYTCGSLGVQVEWVQNVGGGGISSGIKDPQGAGFASAINYGRDCSGSPTERAPGSLATTGTGATGTTCTTVPAAPQLTVQCSTTQNVLKWTNTPNTCLLSVLRSTDNGTSTFIASSLPLTTTTYTDKNVQAGHAYTYRIKNAPSVSSNAVTCNNGVLVAPTATPVPSETVIPGASSTPAPTLIAGSETPIPTSGATPTASPTPVAVGTQTPRPTSGAGGVSTGPGDATLLALIISMIVSLLYVSYTHSSVGIRREVDSISKDQGPMDFRS